MKCWRSLMGKWSEHVYEIRAEIFQYKLDECMEAAVSVLREMFMKNTKDTTVKVVLFEKMPKIIHDNRYEDGIYKMPSVENRDVTEPNYKFIKNNWSKIRLLAAQNGHYIICNPKGATGIRLGSLDEFIDGLPVLKAIAIGVVDTHGIIIEIATAAGGATPPFLTVEDKLIPERV